MRILLTQDTTRTAKGLSPRRSNDLLSLYRPPMRSAYSAPPTSESTGRLSDANITNIIPCRIPARLLLYPAWDQNGSNRHWGETWRCRAGSSRAREGTARTTKMTTIDVFLCHVGLSHGTPRRHMKEKKVQLSSLRLITCFV